MLYVPVFLTHLDWCTSGFVTAHEGGWPILLSPSPHPRFLAINIIFFNTFAQSDYTSVMRFTRNFREILNIIQVVFRSFSRSLAIYCPILHRLLCLYPAVNKVQLLEILHENLPYKINLQKSVSVNWCFGICYLCKLC